MTSRRSVLGLATAVAVLAASSASAGWDEGVAAFKAGDYARAIAEFQQFVEERAEESALLAAGYQMLAQSLLRGGEAREAIAAFQRHLELKPGDVGSQVYLGQAYYKSVMLRECVATLNRLNIASLPKGHQIQVYQMRGASYARLGNTRAAAADLGRIADLKGDARSRFDYGRMLHHDGQFDAAVASYEEAISMVGGNAAWEKVLVNALFAVGRTTEGAWARRQVYSRAEEMAAGLVESGRNYDSLVLLGTARLGAGRYQEAISTLRRAIKLERNDWLAHYCLGHALTSRGRIKEAEKSLRTALGLASDSDVNLVRKQLGYLYWRQENYAEAAEAFAMAGDFESVRRVREEERRVRESERAAEEELDAIEDLDLGGPWRPAPASQPVSPIS